jgi:hypothetical protein
MAGMVVAPYLVDFLSDCMNSVRETPKTPFGKPVIGLALTPPADPGAAGRWPGTPRG